MKKKNGAKNGTVRKIPQPHGGALNSGGTPGNKGGTGRPPNAIRALARELLDKNELLQHLAHLGKNAIREGDQINATLGLVKVGIPNQVEVGENPDQPMMTPEQRAERLKKILGG